MLKSVTTTKLFNKLMKATVYGQFVTGENSIDIRPTVAKYHSLGIRPLLAYAVEDKVDNTTSRSVTV